jgi:methanogenic corrinoid protein MtbC1
LLVEHHLRLDGATLGRPPHICAFVDSPDEEYDLLLPFVREGLEAGEKALHFVDGVSQAEHFRRLGAAGIDVAACLATGQLDVRSWQETYLKEGTFDTDAMLAFLGDVLRAARAEGFPRTRLIGLPGWGSEIPVPPEALADYEMRVNRILRRDDPVICVYDRAELDATLAAEVLCAHPLTIIDGAIRESPSFRRSLVSVCKPRDATDVLRERYVAALLTGDRRMALDVVVEEGLASCVDVPGLYLKVIQPALYEIGSLWEQGRLNVTQEHLATTISRLALAQLYPHLASQPENGKLALVACVEGEFHDLGAHMVADLLDIAGFDARFLGANVPTASLVAAVRAESPQLLVLSATLTANLEALRQAIIAVRDASKSRIALAVGGQALATARVLPHELGADVGGLSALDAVAAVRRLLHV